MPLPPALRPPSPGRPRRATDPPAHKPSAPAAGVAAVLTAATGRGVAVTVALVLGSIAPAAAGETWLGGPSMGGLSGPSSATSGAPTGRSDGGLPHLVGEMTTPRSPRGSWPLTPQPVVVRPFGPPSAPWLPGHRGVDLAGAPGRAVRSAVPGTVTFARQLAGRGVVVVSHGRLRTTYEPVAATVAVGDRVGGGDQIGRLEWSGTHCPPVACLHWGLREGERYLDPLTLLGPQPVRLLPRAAP